MTQLACSNSIDVVCLCCFVLSFTMLFCCVQSSRCKQLWCLWCFFFADLSVVFIVCVAVEMLHKQFCCFVDDCATETRCSTHTFLRLRLPAAKATRKLSNSGAIFRSCKLTDGVYAELPMQSPVKAALSRNGKKC